MIKFFRRIRQNLLSEGKTGKYFKYAIGEILLVVIGILIALQISNWNNNRIERIQERKILDNIHADFLYNKEQFEITKANHQKQLKAFDKINSLFPIDNYLSFNDTLSKYIWNLEVITYNPTSSSVISILNSNNINIIKNDSLKRYLTQWLDVRDDYLEEEVLHINFLQNQYNPYIFDDTDYRKLIKSTSLIKYQNMAHGRRNYIYGIVRAQENESIELFIDEIIRLSKPIQ